ncbi:MAG: hypothetical protein AB1394_01285 [Bacteroidota bacterium]
MIRKIFVLLIIVSTTVFAQISKDSLIFSTQTYTDKQISNSYEKMLNTHNFSALAKYFISNSSLFFGIKENFNSTVIKTSTTNIKDEQYLWALGQYTFSEQFKVGLHFNNNIYSDDRNIGLNKASLLTSSVFVKYMPAEKIQITPFAGFEQNNQIGVRDVGVIYGAEANIDRYETGDFEINSIFKIHNENISPRKNSLSLFSFDLKNDFEENFTNTISAYYSQQRRDFYFPADQATANEFDITNNIQSRTESSYFIQDRIRFLPHDSPFLFDLQGRIAWRGIDRETRYISAKSVANTNYDTKIEEFKLEFASLAEYTSNEFLLSLRFSFSEKDEKHQPVRYDGLSAIIFEQKERLEDQKNNTSQLANLSLSGMWSLSRNDKVIFNIFHRKLKYDTPGIENFDDRDELLSIGRIRYEHQFNSFFKAFVNLESSLNKTIYIFAERSANNNIKRTLKLSSGAFFQTGKLTSMNSAEVSANYTVFDYEELNPNFRSYSFRQFAFRDSSQFIFNKTTKMLLAGYVKLSEQGDFKWSTFSGKPQRYLQEIFAEPKINYDYFGFILGIGARYFSLSTFNIKNGTIKTKASNYESIGPLAELTFIIDGRISLKFLGWIEYIKAEDNTTREMASLSIRMNYQF